MMIEMGHAVSPVTVADHYADLLTGFVIDDDDDDFADNVQCRWCSPTLS